jgi:hypothetical protein
MKHVHTINRLNANVLGLIKMRKGEQLNYPSDLAPLAPLRGEGPGEKGARVSVSFRSIEAFQASTTFAD